MNKPCTTCENSQQWKMNSGAIKHWCKDPVGSTFCEKLKKYNEHLEKKRKYKMSEKKIYKFEDLFEHDMFWQYNKPMHREILLSYQGRHLKALLSRGIPLAERKD